MALHQLILIVLQLKTEIIFLKIALGTRLTNVAYNRNVAIPGGLPIFVTPCNFTCHFTC